MGNHPGRHREHHLASYELIIITQDAPGNHDSVRCYKLLRACQERLKHFRDFNVLLLHETELVTPPESAEYLENPTRICTCRNEDLDAMFPDNPCLQRVLRKAFPLNDTDRHTPDAVVQDAREVEDQVAHTLQELEPGLQETRDYLFGWSYYLGSFNPPTRVKLGYTWIFPVAGACSVIAALKFSVSWGAWLLFIISVILIASVSHLVVCYKENQDGDVPKAKATLTQIKELLQLLHSVGADWTEGVYAKALRMRDDLQAKVAMAEYRPGP